MKLLFITREPVGEKIKYIFDVVIIVVERNNIVVVVVVGEVAGTIAHGTIRVPCVPFVDAFAATHLHLFVRHGGTAKRHCKNVTCRNQER